MRLVKDFTNLNMHMNRPVYPFPCTREILQDVPPSAKMFAKLDTVQGYFQIAWRRTVKTSLRSCCPRATVSILWRFLYLI